MASNGQSWNDEQPSNEDHVLRSTERVCPPVCRPVHDFKHDNWKATEARVMRFGNRDRLFWGILVQLWFWFQKVKG